MSNRLLKAFGVAAALGVLAGEARAESSLSSPLLVEATPAPFGEQIAAPSKAVLVQPMRSIRAAKLDEDASTQLGFLAGSARSVPAGTHLFGAELPDGWAYCAVVSQIGILLLSEEDTVCFQDTDDDGRLDHVRHSGQPFASIPLLIFQPGPLFKLDQPVRFSPLPIDQGPSVKFVFYWQKSKTSKTAPPGAQGIAFIARVEAGKRGSDLSGKVTADLAPGSTAEVNLAGARLTLLGLTPEGALRYRVDRPMPTQVRSINMVLR